MRLYFKLAVNNLLKRKNNTAISLIGLTIAFVAIFHIYAILRFEKGYDMQHKKADRIYRISGDIVATENTMTHAIVGPLMGPGLKDEFPAIESYVRLVPIRHAVKLEADSEIFEVEEAYTVDSTVFNIFTFHFVFGSQEEALRNPNEIVINKSLSKKIYGNINPIGKTIVRDGTPLKVAGVIEDCAKNAHHKLNVLFSIGNQWNDVSAVPEMKVSEAFWMPSCYVFVLLYENAKIEDITNNFQPFYEKYMSRFGKAINSQFVPVAVPLKDLHFSRNMSYDYPKGNRTYSYIFMVIGLFILVIAFINYSNLLVSQNIVQSKNVGIRKINGAGQSGIYIQLLFNSAVVIIVALFFAIILYWLSVPLFSKISIVHSLPLSSGVIILFSIGLLVLLSFLSSLLPFSNQAGKSGLKLIQKTEKVRLNKGQINFGRISTIAQLSLSIVLLISIMLIGKQLNFLTKSDMGFDKENVVLIKLNKTICSPESVQSLKQEIRKDPHIESVAFSSYAPGEVMGSLHFLIKREGQEVTKIVNGMGIDYDYIPLMKMELSEGRNLDLAYNDADFKSIIINEAAIDFCGFTPPVVGKEIEGIKIVGVLKDVCLNSLHNQTEPVVFYLDGQKDGYLNIRLRTNSDLSTTIDNLQKTWKVFYGDEPFNFQFLDQRVRMLYDDDYAKSRLIELFTLVTLLISLMGLFNISLIQTKQKTKEIGIRKINGAQIKEILTMLNKDFVKWVAIAFVIATPVAYFTMNKWLEGFAYKTTLSWWIFALAGLLALGIALLTVSWQSWRAATRNPVEALRYE